MAWVYRKYAKNHSLYVLQNDARTCRTRVVERALSLYRLGNGGNPYGTQPFNRFAMPDSFRRSSSTWRLPISWFCSPTRRSWQECGRILAMNLAHYKTKYGELPQDDGMFSARFGGTERAAGSAPHGRHGNACGSVGKRDSGAG